MKSLWNRITNKKNNDLSSYGENQLPENETENSGYRNTDMQDLQLKGPGFFGRHFYNHRKYFLYGYIVLFLSVIPITNELAVLCFFTTLLSVYFFGKGFYCRNILLTHREQLARNKNRYSVRQGFVDSFAPQKAVISDHGKGYGDSIVEWNPENSENNNVNNENNNSGGKPTAYSNDNKAVNLEKSGVPKAKVVKSPDIGGYDYKPVGSSKYFNPNPERNIPGSVTDDFESKKIPYPQMAGSPGSKGTPTPTKEYQQSGGYFGKNQGRMSEIPVARDAEFKEVDYFSIPTAKPTQEIEIFSREGKFLKFGKLKMERYMAILVLGNILLFSSYLITRVSHPIYCFIGFFGLLLIGASLFDKKKYGIKLYPVYQHMVRNGYLLDKETMKTIPTGKWYAENLSKKDEKILSRDSRIVNNWKPHSFALTNRGIYLERRKGLVSGKKFIYIPLLALKGLKLKVQKFDRSGLKSVFISLIFVLFWAPLIIFTIIDVIRLLLKRGKLILGSALNLSFILTRKEDSKIYMEKHLRDIDKAHETRVTQEDSRREISQYVPYEKNPPSSGLQDVKRSVRSASTGIILPIFFYSMMKLMDILDVDTGETIIFVLLVLTFAFIRIGMAIHKTWKYQNYLKRPHKGTINLGLFRITLPEILITAGYTIISLGILWSVIEQLLTLAFLPGIIGGLLVLLGRYTYNSKFMGLDYQDKSIFELEKIKEPWKRTLVKNKRMITPMISFLILVMLMVASAPYFGLSKAEVPDRYLDKGGNNNWVHNSDNDTDIVGLMGMFGLSMRTYEDDASDNDDYYPAMLAVVTMKFPYIPDSETMLDEMKKYLNDYSEEEKVILEDPPEEGQKKNTQGYSYMYFIYNGTAQNGTTSFSRGQEMRIIVCAYKVDDVKSIVIAVGMAQISYGRLIDVPFPIVQVPNPTDTRDMTNWNELRDDLIPNIWLED